jgi:dTMP kinase
MTGLFITFEGPEGSGKSTQVRILAKYLSENGRDFITSREPGGTYLADALRTILLDKETGNMSAKAELLLLQTARADHVEKIIKPAIDSGQIVICDRFTDSSIAYQGGGRGIDTETICRLNSFSTGDIKPDLTFILDVPPEIGLERARGYGRKELDRLESEDLDFHIRVRETFLALAKKSPERYLVLSGTESVASISEKITSKVEEALSTR